MKIQDTMTDTKLQRHLRFWDKLTPGEGGYLAIETAMENAPRLDPPKDLEEQWLSTEYALRRIRHRVENNAFILDAIPCHFINLGPGAMAPMLGGGYELKPDTVWFDTAPNISDFENVPPINLNREHALYKVIRDQIQTLAADSKGEYKVSFTDIGGTLDIVASLRGNQDMLADLVEYTDEVKAVSDRIDKLFMEYFYEQATWLAEAGAGYTGWIPLVHEKTWYPLQCDACAMISPRMFEKLVLPSLEYTSSRMGTSVYHLDGPGEIPHLDMILSLPNVHAIQWVPLPEISLERGTYIQHFDDEMSLDVYRRTLAAGKKVVLCGVRPDQIPKIYRETGADGVFIFAGGMSFGDAVDLAATARREGWVRL